MRSKKYTLTVPQDVMNTAKKLAGDLPLSRYVTDAIKTKNRSVIMKQRSQIKDKPKLDQATLDYIRAHPEEISIGFLPLDKEVKILEVTP